MNDFKQLLNHVQTQIINTCPKAGPITVVAVSKKQPQAAIERAYAAGQRHFAESYVQEALEKITTLNTHPDIQWHFIGPIQSNKTTLIAKHFHWVHSVDRLKIAERLARVRPEKGPPLNICLQVNISGEAQKSGFTPEALLATAIQVRNYPTLKLRGLMAIAENTLDEARLIAQFKLAHRLYQQLKTHYPDVDTLSLGMSNDYLTAIQCGSNLIRLGTALFGAREI